MDPLDAVVSKLRSMPGVIDVWQVDAADRMRILQLEEKAGESTGFAGLAIVNEGAMLALQRDVTVCVNHSSSLPHPSKPILVLMADEDVIGQEIWEERQITRFQADPNAIFLGKSFILFREKLEAAKGKTVNFVFEPQGFPEIETIRNVCNVVSATISRAADMYIKSKAGWDTNDFDKGTILIGFNICEKT